MGIGADGAELARATAFGGSVTALKGQGARQPLAAKRRNAATKWAAGASFSVVSRDPVRMERRGRFAEASDSSSSLEDLYAEMRGPMIRLAYLLTGNGAVAEDLVQDSFTRLYERWSDVQRPGAYLRTSVLNACRGYHRRRFRERSHFTDLVPDEVSTETPAVLDALARLPYRQRAALVLRFYEDRPERDIADALGCRPATVRSLVHRGLMTLRKAMEP